MDEDRALGRAVALMMASDEHDWWPVHDIQRLIVPPIILDQYLAFDDPPGFVTWAWLTNEAADGYILGSRKLQPGDWAAGDQLWLVDFIAPFGGVTRMVRQVYERLVREGREWAEAYSLRWVGDERRVQTWKLPEFRKVS